jgi:RimJ/RimL family protein N-acetyltransferase
MTDNALTVAVPRIETPRLLLREYRMSDFDAYAEHHTDPVVTAHTGGALDRRSAWRSFLANAGSWVVQGLGWWAMEVRATGEFVGFVGSFIREGWPGFEVGWVVFQRHWGQGFATEGARAAIAFTFDHHHASSIVALISPENHASLRVAKRLEMRHEADVDFYGSKAERHVLLPTGE